MQRPDSSARRGDRALRRRGVPPRIRRRYGNRFDGDASDPMASTASLVDVMLVFACGLIAALVAGRVMPEHGVPQGTTLKKGRELPEMPESGLPDAAGADGFQPVGQVYRDPTTGRLILVGD